MPCGIASWNRLALSALLFLIAAFASGGGASGAAGAPARCNPGCNVLGIPDCCPSGCTSLAIDARNCGACGNDCLAQGRVCEDANCVVACVPPMVREGENCVLRCDPTCAADEVCHEFGTGTLCCASGASEERWFQCGDTCCGPGMQCCGGYCCYPGFQCCHGKCCAPNDVCLAGSGPDGWPCCKPENICDGVCCEGERSCAADGHCRPACNPTCGPGQVCCDPGTRPTTVPATPGRPAGSGRPAIPGRPGYTVPGGGGRCVAVAELCHGECCPRGQRCGADARNREQKVCCSEAYQWCNGICCPDGEVCEAGKCVELQKDCEPACGPEKSCCTDFVCCECCADPGYHCGHFATATSGGGQPVRVCVPDSPPGGPPWFDPTGCQDLRTSTIYYQGISGRCTGTLVACAASLEVRCPYRGWTVMIAEPGPQVCCERLDEASRTRVPCDPAEDLDCDGRPNPSDSDPVGGASPGPPATGGAFRP